MKKFYSILIATLLAIPYLNAQTLLLNSLGKEPVSGKYQQVVLKEEGGEWQLKFYDHKVVEFNYSSGKLKNQEQISDAVVATPLTVGIQARKTAIYTLMLENGLSVIYQQGAWYVKDGNKVLLKKAVVKSDASVRGYEFVINEDEHFFGGGERALPLNRKGFSFPLFNQPHYGYEMGADALNFSVPFFMSSDGYGILFNNVSKGSVDLGKSDARSWKTSFESGALQFYVIPGSRIADILKAYHLLTGAQPLPPRWAFGNFVSRFGYRSENQVKQVTDTMRTHAFKMDALIFDLFWFGDSIKGTMGNLSWVNQKKWPNPPQMLKSLQLQNIKPVAILEPFILEGTLQFENAKPHFALDVNRKPYLLQDFYFGVGGLIDIFKPSAQQFMWKFYQQQMKNGVIGWWTDLGEPEKHPSDLYHDLSVLGYKRLFAADEVHNAYGHYWNKFLYEQFKKEKRNERLFHLNRSGFAGSQRYSVFPWTGDVARTWSGLQAQVPLLLGMSVSGFPYIHSDAGGFSMVDKADPELYVRWLSFAAFTPIFRPHGTALGDLEAPEKDIPSEPAFWKEPYRTFVKHWIDLRYALLPYNYDLAFQHVKDGKPLMRTLNYNDFSFKHTSLDKQYYWGEHFLVHPVTESGNKSVKTYLPKGQWYDFYTNELTEGDREKEFNFSLQKIPLYVKAGAFVPFWTNSFKFSSADAYTGDTLSVYYYPANNNSFYEWFDDDGKSAGSLEKAQYEIIHFTAGYQGGSREIEISTPILKTQQMKKRVIEISIPATIEYKSIEVNGTAVNVSTNQTGISLLQEGKFLRFRVNFEGKPVKISIK
jgi:oligosaccharide 4-alpha-D-glucosyltransferase